LAQAQKTHGPLTRRRRLCAMADDGHSDVQYGGGILGRFENVRQKKSNKKMIPCDAATSEYLRADYLKPCHLPVDRVDDELNFGASSNMHETRFHKGFHRRHQSDIQQDAARMEAELTKDYTRDHRAHASAQATMDYKERHTFNILTGEGMGRESEFRSVGKKILNPFGCMDAVYAEHNKDASNRIKNSKHRFFEYQETQQDPSATMRAQVAQQERARAIFNEGMTQTNRETVVLGYGNNGKRRTRLQSVGVADNFAHLSAVPPEPEYEAPRPRNASQILFG